MLLYACRLSYLMSDFFFKQKTAYERRISDWSSDVCSSYLDNRTAVAEVLALERAARALGRGICRDPFYSVRSAETAGDWLGGFELVEGRVHAVGRGGGKVYLNFAADWRQD